MADFKLTRFGKLYKEHLTSFKDLYSSTTLLTLSLLTSLGSTTYAKNNNNCISFTTSELSECMQGLLSSRMIRRQLNLLEDEQPTLINEIHVGNYCNIQITPCDTNKFFYTFNLLDQKSQFVIKTPSTILLLSYLLDLAAFNYRAGLGFSVNKAQLNHLDSDLGVTKKTIQNGFKELISNKLITCSFDEKDTSLTSILMYGFNFDKELFNQYSQFVKLEINETLKGKVKHRQYDLSKQTKKVVRVDTNERFKQEKYSHEAVYTEDGFALASLYDLKKEGVNYFKYRGLSYPFKFLIIKREKIGYRLKGFYLNREKYSHRPEKIGQHYNNNEENKNAIKTY